MNIVIYTKAACPNCVAAKNLLKAKGLECVEIDIEGSEFVRQSFFADYPDARQMPQIFIDGQRVGGLAGLQAALKQMEENT